MVNIKATIINRDSLKFHKNATFTCRSCSVGLTKVEITSIFDILGCDIAKEFSNIGNIAEKPFSISTLVFRKILIEHPC